MPAKWVVIEINSHGDKWSSELSNVNDLNNNTTQTKYQMSQ